MCPSSVPSDACPCLYIYFCRLHAATWYTALNLQCTVPCRLCMCQISSRRNGLLKNERRRIPTRRCMKRPPPRTTCGTVTSPEGGRRPVEPAASRGRVPACPVGLLLCLGRSLDLCVYSYSTQRLSNSSKFMKKFQALSLKQRLTCTFLLKMERLCTNVYVMMLDLNITH